MKPCLCTQNGEDISSYGNFSYSVKRIETAMCRRCCAEIIGEKQGECLPTEEKADAGRTCYMGTCNKNGRCVKLEQQLAQRIFSFIQELTVDRLVEFMRSNIVGTIVVLSLIVWIPASMVVTYVDEKNMKQQELEYFTNRDIEYGKYKSVHPNQMPDKTESKQAHEGSPTTLQRGSAEQKITPSQKLANPTLLDNPQPEATLIKKASKPKVKKTEEDNHEDEFYEDSVDSESYEDERVQKDKSIEHQV